MVEAEPTEPVDEEAVPSSPDQIEQSTDDPLSVEQTETPTPEINLNQKKEFFDAIAKQNEQHTKDLESAYSEPRSLAEGLSKIDIVNVQLLKGYLEVKQAQGLFLEGTPEELAEEIMSVEAQIIVPLIAELKNADFEIPEDKIENCISGAREAFYGMVLNGRLTAAKIKEIVDSISVSKEPGEEVSPEHQHLDNIVAYLHLDLDNKTFNIHLYEGLFKENNKDIAFLFRHEFFHSAAYSIWGERYIDFKEAAKKPAENFSAFEDTPELKQVLLMVANPQNSKPFFREYIGKLLDAIEASDTEEDKQFYRQSAAIEIVADLGAHFLEGGKSSAAFLDLRSRYFELDSDALIEKICEIEGVEDKEKLFENYQIDPDQMTPSEIIERLNNSEKLRALFESSSIWQEQLTKKFENKGQNLTKPEFPEDELILADEVEIAESIPTRHSNAGFQGVKAPAQPKPGFVSTALSIWEFISGGKKKS